MVTDLCRGLCDLGPENVVITDVSFDPGYTGVAVYRRGMEEPAFLCHERFPHMFHGTGDVFASFLLGALLNGMSLEAAAALALRLTHLSIRLTLQGGEPLRYGLRFEQALGPYIDKLGVAKP